MSHEREILSSLIKDQVFYRKYGELVNSGFFEQKEFAAINSIIDKYFKKYSKLPSLNILNSEIDSQEKKLEKEYCKTDSIKSAAKDLYEYDFDIRKNRDWIKDKTQRFIQENLLKSAFIESYDLIKEQNFGPILDKFKEVFSISFDDNFGLDYFDDLEERYKRMSRKETVMTTGLTYLDKLLGGGWRNKTLNIIAGPANVGKTMWLINFARNAVKCGKNVVYFTFEISEDEIGKRFDAGFTKTKLGELLNEKDYVIGEIRKHKGSSGTLIVKEYTPRTICSNQISAFLQDLEQKRGVETDLVIIDYLSLMNPNRPLKGDSLYQRGMEIAIELRAMGYEFGIPVISGAQTNRESYGSSAPGMENTGESIAIPQTADTMIIIKRNDEFDAADQVEARVVKSRFSKNGSSTLIGVDYECMNMFNLGHKDQSVLTDEVAEKTRRERISKSIDFDSHLDDIE